MPTAARKLERLRFPTDLNGQAVLDVGCGEGLFCAVAAQRGAAKVIGIDISAAAINEAKVRYESSVIHFSRQDWHNPPDGSFDLILWLSGSHYERDPAAMLRQLSRLLAPNGLLILECGVASGSTKEMVSVQRHSDTRWYPTYPLLKDLLGPDLAFREVSGAELTEGDPIPRLVFHCRKLLPTLLLIGGASTHGKSSFANTLSGSATKVISLDLVLYRIKSAKYHHTNLQEFIRDKHDDQDLSKIYYGIDEAGLTDDYAAFLAELVAPTDRLVIVEGLMTEPQVTALTKQLQGGAVVWESTRRL
jgi:SAM-dependent methyltransferase